MALTRQDNPTLAVNAFKLYRKWLADGTLPEPFSLAVPGLADRYEVFPFAMSILYRAMSLTSVPAVSPGTRDGKHFAVGFANACCASSLAMAAAGAQVKDMLMEAGEASEPDFYPGEACAAAYAVPAPPTPASKPPSPKRAASLSSSSSAHDVAYAAPPPTPELLAALARLHAHLPSLRTDQVRPTIPVVSIPVSSALIALSTFINTRSTPSSVPWAGAASRPWFSSFSTPCVLGTSALFAVPCARSYKTLCSVLR